MKLNYLISQPTASTSILFLLFNFNPYLLQQLSVMVTDLSPFFDDSLSSETFSAAAKKQSFPRMLFINNKARLFRRLQCRKDEEVDFLCKKRAVNHGCFGVYNVAIRPLFAA